jgi:TolA-binding protein
MEQSVLSRLWMQYLGICEKTVKDTPEYRRAIEQALADSRRRGGADDYEITLRHYLGLSYRNAHEYAKSADILSAIIGRSGDGDLNAYNTFMVAMNYKDLSDAPRARDFLERVVKEFPNSGSAQLAESELREMKANVQRRYPNADSP